jgi:hypothetical protein
MLVEVQIVELQNPEKTIVAFNSDVKPQIGDTTIGLYSICQVTSIHHHYDHSEYLLSDGSSIVNPLKVIGEISEFNIQNNFFVGGKLFISCEGTKENPILLRDGTSINLVRFP